MIIDKEPEIVVVPQAVVMPTQRWPNKTFACDVFDNTGEAVALAVRPSKRALYKQIGGTIAPPASADRLPGRWLYVGVLFGIYGHELLELTGRLWPMLTGHAKNISGVIGHRWHGGPILTPAGQDILQIFDLHQVQVATAPWVVDELVVPEATWRIRDCALSSFSLPINHIISRAMSSPPFDSWPPRLFLSRSNLNTPKRSSHEDALEVLATKVGYSIIHPNTLSLRKQVQIMQAAEAIAGVNGSGMHNAMFMRPNSLSVCFDNLLIEDQFTIENLFHIRGIHIDISRGINTELITATLLQSSFVR